jgi:uncharacterized membrane protein YphA (DoxX/SURF4 family)
MDRCRVSYGRRRKIMKSILANKYLLLISRLVLGFIFIYAGAEKIADPDGFAVSISNYRILPIQLVNIFAVAIPWLELFSGILIIFGFSVKENSFIIGSLMTLFTFMVLVAVLRGLDIDCGCFGTGDAQKVGLLKIVENLVLIVLSFNLFNVTNKSEDFLITD